MGPDGNRGAPVIARVTYGEAELRPDPARPRDWTLPALVSRVLPVAASVILLAGNVPMIKAGKHERVLGGAVLAEFSGGAKARLDAPG